MSTLLTSETRDLLQTLCRYGIPLSKSVPFLLRVQNVDVQAISTQAGCHRSLFHKALAGRRTPPPELIATLEERLGFDPWKVAAAAQAEQSPATKNQ